MNPKAKRLFDSLFNGYSWEDVCNCTSNPISVWAEIEPGQGEQEIMTIDPSGICPRVAIQEEEHPKQDDYPFVVVRQTTGEIEGLPEPDGSLFIVSRMILNAAVDRQDLICPDTGETCIRDNKGNILGVTQFVAT